MQSLSLFPDLYKLPAKRSAERRSFKGLITDLVSSDSHSTTDEFDKLNDAQAEIERLTRTGPVCEDLDGVDEAFSILGSHVATDRATRLKLYSIQALRPLVSGGPSLALQGLSAYLTGGASIGIVDSLVGFSGKVGSSINERFDPKRLAWALKVTGIAEDDLFYYKNQPHIDDLARRFQESARKLTVKE